MNDPRGSIWRKWDLHVHTPASFHWNAGKRLADMTSAERATALDQIIDSIATSEVAAFAVMDYWTFDGYIALRKRIAERQMRWEKTIFPGIELRVEAPVDYRLNIHAILSDLLTDTQLSDFKSALRIGGYDRPLSDELLQTFGRGLDPSKAQVHGFSANDLTDPAKLLKLGSMTAKITRESLFGARKVLPPDSCLILMPYDTSDGLRDLNWKSHPHDDNYFMRSADIFETRDQRNVDLFLGRETDDNREILPNFIKTMGRKAKPAISGSDAHTPAQYGVFPNGRTTWIKADPTFEGLLQIVREPRERTFIGTLPPKLKQVQSNKTKYMRSLRIEKTPGANFSETWFNNTIPLNTDLVAIIGNKGKGKSALTDVIGLLCNTKQHRSFSFLSTNNFRQPRNNKAKHFQACLTWEDGTRKTMSLDNPVDEQQPELVKYIPQNFLEQICTQIGSIEESDFDRELKNVIFSHVGQGEKLAKASLDALIEYHTTEAIAKAQLLRKELRVINEEIVALEDRSTPEFKARVHNSIEQKKLELGSLDSGKPTEVTKPENDPTRQKEVVEASTAIEQIKGELADWDRKIEEAVRDQAQHTQLIATTERLLARIDNLERLFQSFTLESKTDFEAAGLPPDVIAKLQIDRTPLTTKRSGALFEQKRLEGLLDAENTASFVHQRHLAQLRIDALQKDLDHPNRQFQEYLQALANWERQRAQILGDENTPNTIAFLEKELHEISLAPEQLTNAKERRLQKALEVHAVTRELGDTYRRFYAPVNRFIETQPLVAMKFQLNFEVGLVDVGFRDKLFDFITHAAAGTFCGVEDGNKALAQILSRHSFDTSEGTKAFLQEFTHALENDTRNKDNVTPVRVASQMRKGKQRVDLYDMIFSLEYMKPRYALRMGTKELHQLSPGERGTLLLVFYLLVDKDDIPLVIDQPEENLDNQTVFELLVPCIKEAKQRRQIVMVTHNPNLAVVCDAEQVIFADLNKQNNFQSDYLTGAIENPTINKHIVDVLEGTMPAFENRDAKYLPTSV